jgi:hypothetical protein
MTHRRALPIAHRAVPIAHRAVPFALGVPVLLASTSVLVQPGPALAQALERLVPLASLPAPPPPLGLPLLQQQISCPGLQKRLLSALGAELPGPCGGGQFRGRHQIGNPQPQTLRQRIRA